MESRRWGYPAIFCIYQKILEQKAKAKCGMRTMIEGIRYLKKSSEQKGLNVFHIDAATCKYLNHKNYYSANKYKKPKVSRWCYL